MLRIWAVLAVVLVFCCSSFNLPCCADESGIGAVPDMVLHDKKRNKDLHVRVTYPTGEGVFPIVIFSHGAGGSKDSYQYLIKHWAGKGFVCVQPTHADAIGTYSDKEVAYKKLMNILAVIPTDYKGWANRVADIKLVLDSLPAIQQAIPATMDQSHIGLGGHSYGAFTSMIMGGGTVPKPGNTFVKNPIDNRIAAILVMSPQGIKRRPRDFGFDNAKSFSGIIEPAMFMTGSLDQTGWTKPADRKVPFLDSPAGDKYFVDIRGANHMTFAGLAQKTNTDTPARRAIRAKIQQRIQQRQNNSSISLTGRLAKFFGPIEQGDHAQMLSAIELASTDFWDAYLKDMASDKEAIKSQAIAKENPLITIMSK